MRCLARAILSVMLVTGSHCGAALAQGSPFGWWPFGQKEEQEQFVRPPSTLTPDPPAVRSSGTAPSKPTSPETTTARERAMLEGPSAPATPPPSTARESQLTAPTTVDTTERKSFFPHMAWPEFHMPQVAMPKPQLPFWPRKEEVDQTRNNWVERNPGPATPSPWQAVTDGAQRVGTSTKNAWRKTVDVFTPGDSSSPAQPPRVAQRNAAPSFWSRMLPGDSRKEPKGPRTITEWMGQERLKP